MKPRRQIGPRIEYMPLVILNFTASYDSLRVHMMRVSVSKCNYNIAGPFRIMHISFCSRIAPFSKMVQFYTRTNLAPRFHLLCEKSKLPVTVFELQSQKDAVESRRQKSHVTDFVREAIKKKIEGQILHFLNPAGKIFLRDGPPLFYRRRRKFVICNYEGIFRTFYAIYGRFNTSTDQMCTVCSIFLSLTLTCRLCQIEVFDPLLFV